jgi:acetyltransferase-like isoleucine patch superfamily enzyme
MKSALFTDLENTAEVVITGWLPRKELSRRSYQEHVVGGPNAHARWYAVRNDVDGPVLGPIRIVRNYVVIYLARHCPSLSLKRWLFRRLGMTLGKEVTIASGAVLDYFFPELVEIGENTVVGMDSMILTHEFLHDRWRSGRVSIGRNVLLGAQSTILAGVTIGDGAIVGAKSLVHRNVPPRSFVSGVPIELRESR